MCCAPAASALGCVVTILSPVLTRPGASPRSRRCRTSWGRPRWRAKVAGRISPALLTKRWSSKAMWMPSWNGVVASCVVASIGCSWSGVVFCLENHYPRCTGALSYLFNPPRHSSFRWIGAKEQLTPTPGVLRRDDTIWPLITARPHVPAKLLILTQRRAGLRASEALALEPVGLSPDADQPTLRFRSGKSRQSPRGSRPPRIACGADCRSSTMSTWGAAGSLTSAVRRHGDGCSRRLFGRRCTLSCRPAVALAPTLSGTVMLVTC